MKQIKLELVRKNGHSQMSFEVAPEITQIYKAQSTEERESTNWPGNKFYYAPTVTQSETYRRLLSQFNCIDDYGQPLISTGSSGYPRVNIAFIRTVAGKGKIEIPETFTVAELSSIVKNACAFLKQYFTDYFQEATIKGTVSVEL